MHVVEFTHKAMVEFDLPPRAQDRAGTSDHFRPAIDALPAATWVKSIGDFHDQNEAKGHARVSYIVDSEKDIVVYTTATFLNDAQIISSPAGAPLPIRAKVLAIYSHAQMTVYLLLVPSRAKLGAGHLDLMNRIEMALGARGIFV